jgi:DNA-binding GntR family transcriptional regulator
MVNTNVAYKHIWQGIVSGHFPAGSPLRTQNLEDAIGVSRTPIRDALRKLERVGLVVIRPNLGARVRTMDVQALIHVCRMRQALETHAAGLAAEYRSERDIREMRDGCRKMERYALKIIELKNEEESIRRWFSEDRRFHHTILLAAGNPLITDECVRILVLKQVMARQLRLLWTQFHRSERAAQLHGSTESHRKVLAAIEEKNGEKARVVMEQHLQNHIDKCTRVMEQERRADVITRKTLQQIEKMEQLAQAGG